LRTEARHPLHNLRVLVTRPAHQNEELCRLISQAGGIGIPLPMLLIVPPINVKAARLRLQRLAEFDIAIFISRNAVEQAFELLDSAALPPGPALAAVGAATATALKSRGCEAILMPETDFSSEGLLMLNVLREVRGRRIAIIRGEGGRELLAAELQRRGATVEAMEIYRRQPPAISPAEWQAVFSPAAPDLLTASSTLVLQNLLELIPNDYRNSLVHRPLAVLGERSREYALQQGFQNVYIAPQNDDWGLLQALLKAAANPIYTAV
jgi:uroporphyrinogen-III synthase